MRKILALVMVLALATVLSGCRILGDYDNDGTTAVGTQPQPNKVQATGVKYVQTVKQPANAVATSATAVQSIHAAVYWKNITLTLGTGTNKIVLTPASWSIDPNTGDVKLKYEQNLSIASLTAASPGYTGKTTPVKYTITMANGKVLSGNAAIDDEVPANDPDGWEEVDIEVDIDYDPITGVYKIGDVTIRDEEGIVFDDDFAWDNETIASGDIDDVVSAYDVEWNETSISDDEETFTPVNSLTPTFFITLSHNFTPEQLAAAHFVVYVENVETGTNFTLDSNDQEDKALFDYSITGVDNNILRVSLTGEGRQLTNGGKYMVSLEDSTLTDADGNEFSYAAPRYFQVVIQP